MSVQRQIDKLIAQQAAEWFEALRCGEGSRNAAFVSWVSESPRHMQAFLSMAADAQATRAAFAQGGFDLGALLAKVSPQISEVGTAVPPPTALAALGARPQGRRRQRWALAAAAAVVLGIALAASWSALWPEQRFTTPVGEQRTIQLAEGSVVNLNATSVVEVRYNEARREIRLKHGEATFKVAPDRARPFVVRTPHAVVQALGTQFNVYARADGATTVSVIEGKVRVSPESGAAMDLAAGEEARIEATGRAQRNANAAVADAIAWQQRKLVFKRTSLEDMATEFNRYNRSLQIRLEGIEAGAFRFTGAFDADDPGSLAELLAREPGLSVERKSDEIVIRRR